MTTQVLPTCGRRRECGARIRLQDLLISSSVCSVASSVPILDPDLRPWDWWGCLHRGCGGELREDK